MKNTQSKHKTLSQTQTQQTTNPTLDSIAKACFSDELVKDLFGGKMTHLSFDCPENLRNAFKTECKRQGLSVCSLLRNFMTSFIIASRLKACFPNTVVSNVNIGSLVTPVFVKGRVRRVREVESFEVEVDKRKCWYCDGEAVGLFCYLPRGEVYPLCKRCGEELLSSGKWSVVKSE